MHIAHLFCTKRMTMSTPSVFISVAAGWPLIYISQKIIIYMMQSCVVIIYNYTTTTIMCMYAFHSVLCSATDQAVHHCACF